MGLDSVHDIPYFLANFAKSNASKYTKGGYLTSNTPSFAGPDTIPKIATELLKMGWSTNDVKNFLGENWLRVLKQIWKK
jgi:membrane dipeptidase